MKKLVLFCLLLSGMGVMAQSETTHRKKNQNKIQLALLLDVSNSMDGLIDQAKAELWSVVNEASKATKNEQSSQLEIALYEYGRSTLALKNDYVKQLLNFTTDLDTISKVLFSVATNGGDEYCGAVILKSLNELSWDQSDSVYRVIFIAGNEPFNQGNKNYKISCKAAQMGHVIVNTIHCGDSMTGVREFWKNGADLCDGRYFFINQNAEYNDIETPYDSLIKVYNDSLNRTYWAYGEMGNDYKSNQELQDMNAVKMGKSIATKRAVAKSKITTYNNAKWDANDAYTADSTWIEKVGDKDLPKALQGKKLEEKKVILKENETCRSRVSNEIGELGKKRDEYIKKKMAAEVKTERTLGTALVIALREQAALKGFKFVD